MSQPVLLKVYAGFAPATEDAATEIGAACASAIAEEGGLSVSMLGDMVRVSFEGVWFPVEDVAEILGRLCAAGARGRMDVLDLENWRMTRYEGADGALRRSSAPLNNVLDFSGF